MSVSITRQTVIDQIESRLRGALNDSALAAWAFDRFYELELATVQCETGAEAVIVDILDRLMFIDDATFRLEDEELRGLVARLRTP